jgi:diguanylate cyclase (GGDEF)-like protein
MDDCPDLPDWVNILLAGFDIGPALICVFDDRKQLRYANAAYRTTFLPGHEGPISFRGMLQYGEDHGCGVHIDDGNLDRILAKVDDRWCRKPPGICFESDLKDGRWLWVTETWLPSGWMVTVATDITALKHNEKTLKQAHQLALEASRTDALTGLPNRRHACDLGEAMLHDCRARGVPFSLAMIDLDRFKDINDCYGHAVGDCVLKHFAQTCRERLREQDRMGRLGGEEFVLLLPGASADNATSVLNRLYLAFPALDYSPSAPALRYTFSAGLCEAGECLTFEDIMQRADDLLYQAKAEGRNRICK